MRINGKVDMFSEYQWIKKVANEIDDENKINWWSTTIPLVTVDQNI